MLCRQSTNTQPSRNKRTCFTASCGELLLRWHATTSVWQIQTFSLEALAFVYAVTPIATIVIIFACVIPLRAAYSHFRFCHYKLPLDCILWSVLVGGTNGVLPPNFQVFVTCKRACAFMRLSSVPSFLHLFACVSLLLVLLLLLLFCCTCLI